MIYIDCKRWERTKLDRELDVSNVSHGLFWTGCEACWPSRSLQIPGAYIFLMSHHSNIDANNPPFYCWTPTSALVCFMTLPMMPSRSLVAVPWLDQLWVAILNCFIVHTSSPLSLVAQKKLWPILVFVKLWDISQLMHAFKPIHGWSLLLHVLQPTIPYHRQPQ